MPELPSGRVFHKQLALAQQQAFAPKNPCNINGTFLMSFLDFRAANLTQLTSALG
jgi:hypothetical protein